MYLQTAPQEDSPIRGKKKNCGTWAKWTNGQTGDAAMCNGGHYEGDYYEVCPARRECRNMTEMDDGRTHLPIMNPDRPFGGTRILASSPAANQQGQQQGQQQQGQRPFMEGYEKWLSGLSTTQRATIGQQQQQGAMSRQAQPVQNQQPNFHHFPHPIMPPENFPQAMQTPYAAPIPHHAGGITPTFLPEEDGNIWMRLGKNVAQGMIGSTGWHVFDFARNVDLFR